MMMDVRGHGGECCGIDHIFNMGWHPQQFDNYTNGATKLERLDKILEDGEFSGVIEIVLCSEKAEVEIKGRRSEGAGGCFVRPIICSQVGPWRKELNKRGFRQVTKAYNNNSGNYVFIFHKKVSSL